MGRVASLWLLLLYELRVKRKKREIRKEGKDEKVEYRKNTRWYESQQNKEKWKLFTK